MFLFSLFRGFLLFSLMLDAHDLPGDRADLHLRDCALRVADVERLNELTMLALQLAALDIPRRV
jgi:hypothetical protein